VEGQNPWNIYQCLQQCDEPARRSRLLVCSWPPWWQARRLAHPCAAVWLAKPLKKIGNGDCNKEKCDGCRKPEDSRRGHILVRLSEAKLVSQTSSIASPPNRYHIFEKSLLSQEFERIFDGEFIWLAISATSPFRKNRDGRLPGTPYSIGVFLVTAFSRFIVASLSF